jgi:hypothetical protein
MDLFFCVRTEVIEEKEEIPPINEEPKILEFEECSWAGCGIEITGLVKIVKRARTRKRNYGFCCEECYLDWLSSGRIGTYKLN